MAKEDKITKIKCPLCDKEKPIREFYKSNSPRYKIHRERSPYCKKCLSNYIYNKKTGLVDRENFRYVLKEYLDKPFYQDVYIVSVTDEKNTLGTYLRNLSIVRKAGKQTWEDGETEDIEEEKENEQILKPPSVEITKEMIDKWGCGYTKDEYNSFEKKWSLLIDNYGEKTSFHTENLKTYIRFRVKEEMATAMGDVKEAKEWGALADKAGDNAKINVKQLSKSDLSGGVDLVCQIFEAVETEVGVIPLLPKLLEQPYDDADMVIWSVINYIRSLEAKDRVSYREIWDFYDDMLQEYFTQQGFDEDQIQDFKERRNNVFRDLQKIYKEPVYEETE